jgi:hypothetical protein
MPFWGQVLRKSGNSPKHELIAVPLPFERGWLAYSSEEEVVIKALLPGFTINFARVINRTS